MCTTRATRSRAAGTTLIELIVALVIVGIAVAGVLTVYVSTVRRSADPMVQQQAQFLAEAYLEEILLKRFFDPETGLVCSGPAEAGRALFDNVCDYNGLVDTPPQNQFGVALAGLAGYTVSVAVDAGGTVNLNGLNNAPAVRVLRVDVTVTGPNNVVSTLSGYRANYNCEAAANPGCRGL
jgi:MSHA pilin protein MshD